MLSRLYRSASQRLAPRRFQPLTINRWSTGGVGAGPGVGRRGIFGFASDPKPATAEAEPEPEHIARIPIEARTNGIGMSFTSSALAFPSLFLTAYSLLPIAV